MLILIIDDEEKMLYLMKEFLEERGFSVLTAPDGKTGLEIALKECPRLVVVDVAMPEMNGYQVCEALRAHKDTAKIPILIITGMELTPEGVNKRCEELNIDAFMFKPFSIKDLLAKIEEIIDGTQAG